MKLKSLFSLLGFEIYRKSKKNKIKFDSSQKPLYIELVGVSGVGKSTIYQKAIQNQFNFWTLNDFKENNPKVNFQAVLDGQSFYQDAYPIVDRKSTRLNSSHVAISYAVFCLK